MDAHEFYRAGRLAEAIAAMNEEVRKNPADMLRRGFLAELLLVSGNLERADVQLDTLAQQDAQAGPSFALLRQIVRAEQARRQFHAEGRVPEFLGLPTPSMGLRLRASVALREGRPQEASTLLDEAEAVRVHTKGTCDGKPFEDLRDLDDMTADFLEVLTSTGKYYWVPMEHVVTVEFRAPTRPRDLVWRRAAMSVKDGPEGEVFVAAIYPTPAEGVTDAMRLGRVTEWRGGDGVPVRGVGQRTLLVDEEARPLVEIREIRVEN